MAEMEVMQRPWFVLNDSTTNLVWSLTFLAACCLIYCTATSLTSQHDAVESGELPSEKFPAYPGYEQYYNFYGTKPRAAGRDEEAAPEDRSGRDKADSRARVVRINPEPLVVEERAQQAYKSEPFFDAVEHSFASFPEEDLPTPTQETVSPVFETPEAAQGAAFPGGLARIETEVLQVAADCSSAGSSSSSSRSPVDQNGRRNKKSVVPGQLDAAFFRKRAHTLEQEERESLARRSL